MKSKKIIFSSFFLVVILLAFVFKLTSVSEYQINLDNALCVTQGQIQEEINILNQNYFLINFEFKKEEIKKKYICVKDLRVNFVFPQRVQIDVVKRLPVVKVIQSDFADDLDLKELESSPSTRSALLDWRFDESSASGDFLIVDSEGVVYDFADGKELPSLFISQGSDLKVGAVLGSERLGMISEVFKKTKSLGIEYTQSKLVSNAFLINSIPKIVFGLNQDIFRQLISLQLILDKARMNNSEIESIDLRFKNPVIIYSDKKTTSLNRERMGIKIIYG